MIPGIESFYKARSIYAKRCKNSITRLLQELSNLPRLKVNDSYILHHVLQTRYKFQVRWVLLEVISSIVFVVEFGNEAMRESALFIQLMLVWLLKVVERLGSRLLEVLLDWYLCRLHSLSRMVASWWGVGTSLGGRACVYRPNGMNFRLAKSASVDTLCIR